MKTLIISLISLTLVSCSSIRMKYEGEVLTTDGKKSYVQAEKSYPISETDKSMCMITGIFFGGFCWFFTVMPTTQQRATMERDVKSALEKQLNTSNFSIVTKSNDKINWEQKEDVLILSKEKNNNSFNNIKVKN